MLLIIFLIISGLLVYFYIIGYKRSKEIKKLFSEDNSLFDERSQLRTLMDNMPDSIYIKDRQSRFVIGNKQVAKVLGTEPKKLVGKTDFNFYSYDLASRFYNDEQTIMKSGESKINYEEPGLDEHGKNIMKSTTKVPLKNKEGEVIGIVGIGRDITRLKNIEKELRTKTEELQETNQLLEERQEELQQAKEELEAQADSLKLINDELERLNKSKDKFFSIIGHDLKNPFHAIMGFSELLTSDFYEMDDQQKLGLLELINISSESAFNLLENLLQWARTQTDRIKFKPEVIDLFEIVNSTIKFHKVSAEKKRVKLESTIKPNLTAFADKNMITTVIRNLVSNALKFVNVDGEVKLTGDIVNEKLVEINIIDNGIGISDENLEKLFRIDSYYSTTGTSGESGTGLGLIICKEFLEKNDGSIKATSKIGIGSTFSFYLKRKKNN